MKRARFLIVCGGTGGHLAPGIAMAQELSAQEHYCVLVVSEKRVDSRLAEKYREQFDFIASPGVAFGWSPWALARFSWGALRSFARAVVLIRRHRPHMLLAFGGFLSTGYVLAARLQQTPVALHEANRHPGRAVRLLARLSARVYLPEGIRLSRRHLVRVRHPGFPLRREIRPQERELVRQPLGIPASAKLLVVFGGSQGAAVLTEWVREHLERLADDGVWVYCLTGPEQGAVSGLVELRSTRGEHVKAWFEPFSDQIASLLSAADLVISRAGAGSLAELVACHTPAVLVPYPYAADNHQMLNARYLEQQGAALVVEQRALGELYAEVSTLLFNEWMLGRLRLNLRKLEREPAAQRIREDLEQLLEEDSGGASRIGEPATAVAL